MIFPASYKKRDIILVTKLADKLLIPIRFRTTQAMVVVDSRQPDIQFLPQKVQSKQQRNRVSAAGASANHVLPGTYHIIITDLPQQLIQHASTPDR